MNKILILIIVALVAALTLISCSQNDSMILAGDDAGGGNDISKPIPAEKQARLLEKFGEQGIDADGDTVLTIREVKEFFTRKYQEGADGWHGEKGKWGHKMKGGWGHGEMTDEHREKMYEHHPEADTDGDGVLSKEEIKSFIGERKWGSGSHGLGKMTEEHRAMVLERHPEADTDGDGALSDEEIKTFISSFCEKGDYEGKDWSQCFGHSKKKAEAEV